MTRLTLIWQYRLFSERDWIREVFRPIAGKDVYDEEHRVVLDDCLVIDSWLHAQSLSYFEQFRGKNAWLLHLCDETYEGGYEVYDCFRGVFRCYWSNIFHPRLVMQIPLGYSAGIQASSDQLTAAQRPYLWSFLGRAEASSRPEMMKGLLPITPHLLHNTAIGTAKRLEKASYQEILRQSVFIPCPMGNVNLECYRVYEALQSGSIPIVEKRPSLDYFKKLLGPHPLPTFTTWNEAGQFLHRIRGDHEAQDQLIAACSQWWSDFKKNLSTRIEQFVNLPAAHDVGSAVKWYRSIPGSQAIELLRHHSGPAIRRRVQKQATRILKEGKVRGTYGV